MRKQSLIGMLSALMLIIPIHALANEVALNEDEMQINVQEQSVSGNDVVLDTPETKEENLGYDYEIYYNGVKARLCEEQIIYLSCWQSELNTKHKIEEEKWNLGYTTADKVAEAEAQLKIAELQIENVNAEKAFYLECIEIYGGKEQEILLMEEFPKLEKDYESIFLQNSVQIKSYNQQIQTNQGYLDKLLLTEAQIQNINSQIELLETEKAQYEVALRVYVKQKELQYENTLREIEQFNYQIKVMEQHLATQNSLFEEGKIAKITIMEQETELQNLRFQRINAICDANLMIYILEHGIENKNI